MTTIGKTGSRSTPVVKQEPVKVPAPAAARPNVVKAAVSQRMSDGFEAGPQRAAPSRSQALKESSGAEGGKAKADAKKKDDGGGGFLGGIASSVGKIVQGVVDAVTKPQVSTNAEGRTVVNLGVGDNTATVSQNKDGGLTIKSGDDTVTLTAAQARGAIINGGAGNDTITLDASVTQDLMLDGGAGDDKLTAGKGNDTVIGGEGNDTLIGLDGDDYLEGGAGDDRVQGGEGRDVLYGLDGKDTLSGGGGRDYIDGGAGDDKASGGTGDDQVLGGRGNDTLSGGSGNDAVAGGEGKDAVQGGTGTDKLYVEENETTADAVKGERNIVDMTDADKIGSSVSVTGSADYQARVQSDLDAMRSMPSGQELLRTLDASGKTTTISETMGGNNANGTPLSDGFMNADGTPGKGSNATVGYNRTRTSLGNSEEWMTRPPVVGLFHELVHASDITNGTLANGSKGGVRNLEPSAVGLPIDLDNDPKTPDVVQGGRPGENVLRDELNLPTRPHY